MDFRPDETQAAIIRLAGEVLDGAAGDPDKAWAALGHAGLLSLAVPERLGGAGLGVLETALVLTEIGRRAVAVPGLPGRAAAMLTGARWGDGDLLTGELLTGAVTLGAAVAEPGDPLPAAPRTAVAVDGAGTGTVTGVKIGVAAADRILVTVDGPGVVIVDPASPGVTTDGAILRLDRAPATRLGGAGCHAGLHRDLIAAACAIGDGALAGALAMTADHVRAREQFGRPIATFQAVAQQIADVYVASRTLHLAALTAAWRLGAGRPADDDLDVAALWLATEAPAAMRTCHHLHGGLGLSVDYPLHRHTALIRDLVRLLGGGEHRLALLGERLAHRAD